MRFWLAQWFSVEAFSTELFVYPADLRNFSGALLIPQPLTFHKPKRAGGGSALKLNLRFTFEFGEKNDERFLKKSKGGLFVDFAAQGANNAAGNATFKWTDRASLVTAKLGMPDISAILVGFRSVREFQETVPVELRAPAREQDDQQAQERKLVTVSLTHKSRQGTVDNATTIISYQFMAQGGVFRVSKSRTLVGQVQLTLAEELRFMRFLSMGLDTIIRVGGR